MIRLFRALLVLALASFPASAQIGPLPGMGPGMPLWQPLFCTGGTLTVSGAIRTHVFFSSGTLTCTGFGNVVYAVVGGGGGGGGGLATPAAGGGGGAGGLLNSTSPLSSGTYTITVGTGGISASSGLSSSFGAIATASGGGGGGQGVSGNGATGGSGGGGAGAFGG